MLGISLLRLAKYKVETTTGTSNNNKITVDDKISHPKPPKSSLSLSLFISFLFSIPSHPIPASQTASQTAAPLVLNFHDISFLHSWKPLGGSWGSGGLDTESIVLAAGDFEK
jgi:hypothetical protein